MWIFSMCMGGVGIDRNAVFFFLFLGKAQTSSDPLLALRIVLIVVGVLLLLGTWSTGHHHGTTCCRESSYKIILIRADSLGQLVDK